MARKNTLYVGLKMPKAIFNPDNIILEFGGPKVWEYDKQRKVFFCKLCSTTCERKFLLRQHVGKDKHKKSLELHERGKNPPQQMLKLVQTGGSSSKFAEDLCKAFVSSNIPLTKVEDPAIVELFEKYAKVPSRWTLTRIMERESQSLLAEIKSKLMGKPLFLIVDETTDCMGRAMCAILVGPLDGTFLERPYLIDLADIKSTNNQSVQQFVNSALFKFFGDDLKYDDFWLFLTDAAAYCLKAGTGLKALFPNLMHCTCLCHALNRVAEKVRYEFPKVDKLIAETKKIFVKSPRRRAEFAAECQVPLPPEPVLTR